MGTARADDLGGADRTLRDLLGADPPESVSALDAGTLTGLAGVISAARERQAADLAAAFDATLRHVPLPARRLVKRVLGA